MSAAAPTSVPDGMPVPQRYLAALTVGLAVFMAVMDSAIANVALPTIASDLHTDPANSIWVVNAYQLAITVTLLPLASLGEIRGYRRVYQAGLAVFTIASLLCALSGSLATLAMARVLQGLGAAGIMSINGALVRFIWPRAQLGRGIGINALVVAVSSAIGPTVAAGILAVAGWQWLFAINVPVGIVAFLIALRFLPRTGRAPHRFDVLSALLNAACFGLLIVGLDGFAHGESGAVAAAEVAAAAGFGVALVRRQMAQASPLLPVDLLRIPIFGLSVATSVCSFAAQALAFVALPFFLQDTLGHTQVETGLLMTPWPLAVGVMAPVAGWLADRYPAGLLGGIGLAIFAAGLLALAGLGAHPSSADVAWRMALCGIGFGAFQTPNNRAMLQAAPRARSGGASGMLATARLLGQTIGAALVAVMFGLTAAHATTVSILLAAAVAVVAAGVSCLRLMEGAAPRRVRS